MTTQLSTHTKVKRIRQAFAQLAKEQAEEGSTGNATKTIKALEIIDGSEASMARLYDILTSV